jgi:ABC-type antimicrobial peptide transport system permease subunit
MALGAQSARILRQVLTESGGLILIGAAIGILLALAGARLVSSMLYGLTATDPATILVSTLVLLAVALLAGYIPARKAARIDPMLALRSE